MVRGVAVLLLGCVGIFTGSAVSSAPVPKHLFPPAPPHPVQVGYQWYFQSYLLEVVWAEGAVVRYRCVNCPVMRWMACPEFPDLSVQTREQTWNEALQYGVPLVTLTER